MTRCCIGQVIFFFSWTATAGFEVLQILLRVNLKANHPLLAGCNFFIIYADSIQFFINDTSCISCIIGQHALFRNSYDIIITWCLLKPITARNLL